MESRRNFDHAASGETGEIEPKAALETRAARQEEHVAVLVCHGMGQQVPFETIDGMARLLRKEIRRKSEGAAGKAFDDEPKITTRIVCVGGVRVGCAELHHLSHEDKSIDVHIYEAAAARLTKRCSRPRAAAIRPAGAELGR